MIYISSSDRQTEEIARKIGEEFKDRKVFCLFGPLGAGKTAFARGLVRAFGYEGRISSPTFTIMHRYGDDIYHFDLYRIKDEDELYEIGFDEFLESGICIIEWPDNFLNLLPPDAVHISIKPGKTENERIITVKGEANDNFGD